MVTRNWYNIFKANRGKNAISNGLKDVDGTIRSAGWYNNGDSTLLRALLLRPTNVVFTTSSDGIVLGSGTTPPTFDDYKLESMITSGLTFSLASTVDEDNDTTYTLTLTNTSAEDIIIGEIGHINTVYIGSNATSTSKALFERTVLDAPVTIPAGEVGLITYTVKLPIPEV